MKSQKGSIPMLIQLLSNKDDEKEKVVKKVDNNAPFFHPSYYFSTVKLKNPAARMRVIMTMNKQLMININTCYRSTRHPDSEFRAKNLENYIATKRQKREDHLRAIDKENITIVKRIGDAKSFYIQEIPRKKRGVKAGSVSRSQRNNILQMERWSIVAEGETCDPSKRVTCYFDVTIDKIKRGRILFEIYYDVVPYTALNFISLCDSDFYPTYKKTNMHLVFPGFFCVGGEINNFSKSINRLRGYFSDENYELKFAGPGVIAMFNSKQNSNATKFLITFKKLSILNGRFVVFGRLRDKKSMEVLQMIEEFGAHSGRPKKKIVITDSGVL